MDLNKTVLLDGLAFPESPRWRDGCLWFSDMHALQVCRIAPGGALDILLQVPQQPSGLGWLPDGRLLVVSMHDRRLLRLEPDGVRLHADLAMLSPSHCNDMVVDQHGRAYVGNFGFDFLAKETPTETVLIMVSPDGHAEVVADGLFFPNGMVITPDGRTLIVGESYGRRLTAFSIAPDGSLSQRRNWAQLDGAAPDGICLDAEGALWVASPVSAEVLRIREGGEVTHRIPVGTQAVACMLGGPGLRTLFILSAPLSRPEKSRAERLGCIETVLVDVPGAGLP